MHWSLFELVDQNASMRKETNHARFCEGAWKIMESGAWMQLQSVKTKPVQYPCSETVVDQPTVVEVFSLFRLSTHTQTPLFSQACFPLKPARIS